MTIYEKIKNESLALSYRDKLRLAQLLIQLARKEEEEHSAVQIIHEHGKHNENIINYEYILERILKSKPKKLTSLENFIKAMFQFKGSITADENEEIVQKLIQNKVISINGNRISYKS